MRDTPDTSRFPIDMSGFFSMFDLFRYRVIVSKNDNCTLTTIRDLHTREELTLPHPESLPDAIKRQIAALSMLEVGDKVQGVGVQAFENVFFVKGEDHGDDAGETSQEESH